MKTLPVRVAAALACLAVVLLASSASGVFPPSLDDVAAPASVPRNARKVWLCPPCGDKHDEIEYDKPGSCPVCGMALVEKSELARQRARAAARAADPATAAKRVEILVFPGVQIIDFTAPYEVFGQAGFEVSTVAEAAGPLTTNMGMKITPDYTIANAPPANVVVVPGGNVFSAQGHPVVEAWLKDRAEKSDVVLSVCNGAFILAKAGLLDGKSATTIAGQLEGLKAAAPKATVVSDRRFVDNGKIVTSAGLSSGIDGSLHVVEKLCGKGVAEKVAVGLEYNWDRDGRWVRAQLADRRLTGLYRASNDWDRDILSHEGTTDAWENRWRLRTKESPAEVLGSVGAALGVEVKGGAFTLKDENGATWRGAASASSDGPGSVLLTVRIEKAHA